MKGEGVCINTGGKAIISQFSLQGGACLLKGDGVCINIRYKYHGIRATSGWYASYWYPFLFCFVFM